MAASVHGLPLPSVQIYEDMPPFPLPPVLRKIQCLADDRLTPPPSPDRVDPSTMKSGVASKIHLAKLLSKRSRSTKSTKQVHRSQSMCEKGGAVVLHQTNIRPPVTHIKTTFPPPLPTSPASLEATGDDGEAYKSSVLELRRVSSSYYDLREIAQRQEEDPAMIPSLPYRTALLPSPIIDEHTMKAKEDSESFLHCKFSNPFLQKREDVSYKSYDDLHILSYYEDAKNSSMDTYDLHDMIAKHELTLEDDKHTPTTNSPASTISPTTKPSSKSSVDSSESDWLANTTSHRERMRRFKARCYQVVQHPYRSSGPEYENEDRIMLATVLVGPGKPKLVQIQRPSSSKSSLRNKQTMYQTNHMQSPSRESTPLPATPVRQHLEVSAFSPYDTPFTDLSHTVSSVTRTPYTSAVFAQSKLELVPQPLIVPRHNSNVSTSTMYSSPGSCSDSQADPFRSSPTSDLASSNIERRWSRTMRENPYAPTPQASPSESPSSWARCRRLERTIKAVTKAINSFPNEMLRLDSPAITDMRSASGEQIDTIHLSNLSNIFPTAPNMLLSALAAWILVDLLFSSLGSDEMLVKGEQSTDDLVDRCLPGRASSLPVAVRDRSKPSSASTTASSRRVYSQPDDAAGPSSMPTSAIARHTTDSLNPIPSKARTVLGIDQMHSAQANQKRLLTQARALRISIGVVAQKLLEALRREGGWDAGFWRALTLIVQMGEQSVMNPVRDNEPVVGDSNAVDSQPSRSASSCDDTASHREHIRESSYRARRDDKSQPQTQDENFSPIYRDSERNVWL